MSSSESIGRQPSVSMQPLDTTYKAEPQKSASGLPNFENNTDAAQAEPRKSGLMKMIESFFRGLKALSGKFSVVINVNNPRQSGTDQELAGKLNKIDALLPKGMSLPLPDKAKMALANNEEFMGMAKPYANAGLQIDVGYVQRNDDDISFNDNGKTVWMQFKDTSGENRTVLREAANDTLRAALEIEKNLDVLSMIIDRIKVDNLRINR